MKDKCILVTGSSSGIGEAITTKLLDLGAKVFGIARDHKKSAIKNDNYITYTFDISDLRNLEKNIKSILKKLLNRRSISLWSGFNVGSLF